MVILSNFLFLRTLLTPHCLVSEFPPQNEESQLPDITDPWKGPQMFAEDFYSGGDIREGDLDPNTVSPSNLTPFREARGAAIELLTPADSPSLTPADGRHFSPQQEIIEVDDDDSVLPDSSPILSSPVDDAEGFDDPYSQPYSSEPFFFTFPLIKNLLSL
jgi:hypothetical protein